MACVRKMRAQVTSFACDMRGPAEAGPRPGYLPFQAPYAHSMPGG